MIRGSVYPTPNPSGYPANHELPKWRRHAGNSHRFFRTFNIVAIFVGMLRSAYCKPVCNSRTQVSAKSPLHIYVLLSLNYFYDALFLYLAIWEFKNFYFVPRQTFSHFFGAAITLSPNVQEEDMDPPPPRLTFLYFHPGFRGKCLKKLQLFSLSETSTPFLVQKICICHRDRMTLPNRVQQCFRWVHMHRGTDLFVTFGDDLPSS